MSGNRNGQASAVANAPAATGAAVSSAPASRAWAAGRPSSRSA
ncbi:hypothetical protein ACFVFS_06995 [Kitasatospora sp. NPDC057692]